MRLLRAITAIFRSLNVKKIFTPKRLRSNGKKVDLIKNEINYEVPRGYFRNSFPENVFTIEDTSN